MNGKGLATLSNATAYSALQASRAGRAGVPTLVVYGRHDAMFSPLIRGYIERTRSQALVLDGGHFIVLGERERVRSEITHFLEAR